MKTTTRFSLLLVTTLVVLSPLATPAQGSREAAPASVAEIRIELPPGADHAVSVEPGRRSVALELPRGSVFPLDFADSTGGLLRGGEVSVLSAERVRLELDLAHGVFDRVEFEPGSVLVRFTSRQRKTTADGSAYRIGVDDRIQITVHNQPELSSSTVVDADGTITAPILGEVEASGLTTRELADRLTELLGRDYLVDPQVDVIVEEYRSQWVMVTGKVLQPGQYMLRGGTRLREVLSQAGGFSDRAGERITVSRTDDATGEVETFEIRRRRFEGGADNLVLLHGDIVEVHDQAYAYISGEVNTPSRIPIERDLTLLQAVARAGGLTDWANKKKVTILYPEGIVPRQRIVNLQKIENGEAEDPVLVGDEKIIVKRRFF